MPDKLRNRGRGIVSLQCQLRAVDMPDEPGQSIHSQGSHHLLSWLD
ncbi:MAG: hypothetical protein SPF72_09805 [Parabacteroides sp.]|nr:hypothetical protein [Parabacteroides sp.]MDD6101312.1 hypothetical protein [bacterium]MDD7723843.1 hypothetical protein [bacterium]MDY3142698.1 hypothetical protein [Parabacteroides sp.]MDY5638849.1 hypothetical protein [Parabacteroides sp.]